MQTNNPNYTSSEMSAPNIRNAMLAIEKQMADRFCAKRRQRRQRTPSIGSRTRLIQMETNRTLITCRVEENEQ